MAKDETIWTSVKIITVPVSTQVYLNLWINDTKILKNLNHCWDNMMNDNSSKLILESITRVGRIDEQDWQPIWLIIVRYGW